MPQRMKDRISEKLASAFSPVRLEVRDESHLHVGHAGHREGGETHFRVHIVAADFAGLSRLERHRLVMELLAAELKDGVHALAVRAEAPTD